MTPPQDRCAPCKITTIHNYSILYDVELKETFIHHAVWWAYVTTLVRRRDSPQNSAPAIGPRSNGNGQSRAGLGRGSFVFLKHAHHFSVFLVVHFKDLIASACPASFHLCFLVFFRSSLRFARFVRLGMRLWA